MTAVEYLESDRVTQFRSQYSDGRACAIGGSTVNHSRIVCAVAASLHFQLEAGPFEPFALNYARHSDASWTLREFTSAEDVIQLKSIACALPLNRIYARVEFSETAS